MRNILLCLVLAMVLVSCGSTQSPEWGDDMPDAPTADEPEDEPAVPQEDVQPEMPEPEEPADEPDEPVVDEEPDEPGEEGPQLTWDEGEEAKIYIKNYAFLPKEATIGAGTEVTFINFDDRGVKVIFEDFESKTMYRHMKWSYTFEDTGTYEYHSSLYKSKTGVIIVV